MARGRISCIRRQELTLAARHVLSEVGLPALTLAQIANKAEMSKASTLHHFSSKELLVEAALRNASTVIRSDATLFFRHADTHWERVYAIIEANFSPTSFNYEVAFGWLTFCTAVPHNPQFRRIYRVIRARLTSNLLASFRQLGNPEQAIDVTMALVSLIDGLWLQRGLDKSEIGPGNVRNQIELLLDSVFPNSRERGEAARKMRYIATIKGNR